MTHADSTPLITHEPPNRRILIVDDEPILLDMLLDIFHDEGFTVYTASNGEDALALLEHQPVDVVLTDFMMPRVSGVELAQRLQANPATASTPVVLMSAASPKVIDQAITIVIAKPFMLEDLIEKVREVAR